MMMGIIVYNRGQMKGEKRQESETPTCARPSQPVGGADYIQRSKGEKNESRY
jgi:hypothetical protein